jgi:hypothetical protein
MICAASVPSTRSFTGRQRSLHRRSCRLPLRRAIRHAASVCFRFTSRAVQGKALWSRTERVWMGKETFFHWAICLPDINIPWMVAAAQGAPEDDELLLVAVRKELDAYWRERLTDLPQDAYPAWLPLP